MKGYYKDSDEWFSALWNYLHVDYDPEMFRVVENSDQSEEAKKIRNKRN